MPSIPEIARRLFETYGAPAPRAPVDPLEELVATILSQRSATPYGDRALKALKARFPTWHDVASAPLDMVIGAIRPAGLATQKGPRIQAILRQIQEERDDFDLAFLRHLPPAEAMEWLCRLPGVGQTTAACVLLFGLGLPVMPVDTGIARVAARLGLVRPGAPATETQRALEAAIPSDGIYALHIALIRHTRDLCRPTNPFCEACPLNDLCPTFTRFLR